jgi:hypothetical protein
MSSPKRVAKHAIKAAANTASRQRLAAAAKTPTRSGDGTSADAEHIAEVIERGIADGRLDVLTTDTLQALIAATCRVYAARRQAGEDFLPIPPSSLTATDVMITASGLLQATNLAVFELGMWQGWTGR